MSAQALLNEVVQKDPRMIGESVIHAGACCGTTYDHTCTLPTSGCSCRVNFGEGNILPKVNIVAAAYNCADAIMKILHHNLPGWAFKPLHIICNRYRLQEEHGIDRHNDLADTYCYFNPQRGCSFCFCLQGLLQKMYTLGGTNNQNIICAYFQGTSFCGSSLGRSSSGNGWKSPQDGVS